MGADSDGLRYLRTDDVALPSGQTQMHMGGPISVLTSGNSQTYRDTVLLGANTTLQATTGDITFQDEVDAADNGGAGSDYGLTVNTLAGSNIFRGRVGSGSQVGADSDGLRYLRTDDVALPSGQTQLNMGGPISVLTSGNSQTYRDTVLLGANTTLQATTGDITFQDEVDAADNGGAGSDYGLTVNTLAGDNIFRGRVGSGGQAGADSDGLRYLRTDDVALPSGQTQLLMVGPISVLTSGNSQTYYDTVLLGANTTLQATTGDITFQDEVDATDNGGAGSDYGLTVNTLAGSNIFRGRVGSGSQAGADSDGLRYLRTDDVALPSGQTQLLMVGPISVLTSGNSQTYYDTVLLGANTALQATTGNITFQDEVDATDNGGAGSDYGLTVNTLAGNNIFRGRMGSGSQAGADSDGLRYLRTDDVASPSGQTRLLMSGPISVLTSGNSQTYYDTVLLGANTTLQAATGDITFQDEVDATDNGGAGSDYGLTVNTLAGNNIFRGRVGSGSQAGADSDGLRYLRTDDVALPSGQTQLSIPVSAGQRSVVTNGDQIYREPVMLRRDAVLESSSGDLSFLDVVEAENDGVADTSSAGLTIYRLNGTAESIFYADVGGHNQPGPGLGLPSDPQGILFLHVHVNGPFSIIRSITTAGERIGESTEYHNKIVVDSLLPGGMDAPNDSLTIRPDAPAGTLFPDANLLTRILARQGNIELLAEDDVTIANHTAVEAREGGLWIQGDYRPEADDPDNTGTVITIPGSPDVGDYKNDRIQARRGTVILGNHQDDTILIDLERLRPRQLSDGVTEFWYLVDGVAQSGDETVAMRDFRTDHYDPKPRPPETLCSPPANSTQTPFTALVGDTLTLRHRNSVGDDEYLLQESAYSTEAVPKYQFKVNNADLPLEFQGITEFHLDADAGADSYLIRMPANGVRLTEVEPSVFAELSDGHGPV